MQVILLPCVVDKTKQPNFTRTVAHNVIRDKQHEQQKTSLVPRVGEGRHLCTHGHDCSSLFKDNASMVRANSDAGPRLLDGKHVAPPLAVCLVTGPARQGACKRNTEGNGHASVGLGLPSFAWIVYIYLCVNFGGGWGGGVTGDCSLLDGGFTLLPSREVHQQTMAVNLDWGHFGGHTFTLRKMSIDHV